MGSKQRKIFITSLSVLFIVAIVIVGFQVKTGDKVRKTAADENSMLINIVSTQEAGQYLADFKARALYTNSFDEVEDGVLVEGCTGDCALTWHPYLASGKQSFDPENDPLLGVINVIERPDGKLQFAANNKPLYRFVRDRNVSDTNGRDQADWDLVTLDSLTQALPSPEEQ